MKFNYLKFTLIILTIVILTGAYFVVYAGAQDGAWSQDHVALFGASGTAVGDQIGGDDDAEYVVAPTDTKLFAVIQANFSTQSKDQDIEVSWKISGGGWAVASQKETGSGTDWEFWESEYTTLGVATNHFGSAGSVYIEDQDSDGGDPAGAEEFWFVIEAPSTEGTYYLAISEDGVVENGQGTIAQEFKITVGEPEVSQKHYRWRNDDGGE